MKLKKIIFILSFIVISTIVFGQATSMQYTNLIKKADRFYRTKNYKNSAVTYSLAFKSIGWKAPVNDRYNAASAWALANIPDSAFYQLNRIADYIDFKQISTDPDLKALHNDKRWKALLAYVKQNDQKKEAKLNKPLIKKLDSIYTEDQTYRKQIKEIEKKFGWNSKEMKALWKIINEKDSINLIKVKAIIDNQGWLGADVIGTKGNSTLFLVIQHAGPKTQEHYLPIMREAVKNGKAFPEDLALLEDRVAMGQGKKQIYGSQIIKDSITEKNSIAPIEDEANVDNRRLEVGLEPLEDYAKNFGIIYKSKTIKATVGIRPSNTIADTAIEIHDSIVGPLNVSRGNGIKILYSPANGAGGDIPEENSVWFKFTFEYDTLLAFDIVPDKVSDDYDFALFKCSGANCINDIRTKKGKPIRYCFSANGAKNGSTGLSEFGKEKYIGSGPGPAYTSAIPVKNGETYYLMIQYSEYYWARNNPPQGFTIYFYNYWPKKPKRASNAIVLENVLFETDKAILRKESFVALDKLISQLQTNKSIKIEIRGHTDNSGDEAKNQLLSENRAKAVVDYLISKKIDKNRLSYKGFGSKQPIASNDTEDGKKKNRRVEFAIIH